MKSSFIFVATLALVCIPSLCLASTLQVSNLSEVSETPLSVHAGEWWATSFTTGNVPTSFTAAELRLSLPGDVPAAPLVVTIYEEFNGHPGSVVDQLIGPSPSTPADQLLTYTPSVPFLLGTNTTYWLAVSNVAAGPGVYLWPTTSWNTEFSPSGWTLGDVTYHSVNSGGKWSQGTKKSGLFAIYAEPVPEPSTLLLMVTGIIGAFWVRYAANRRSRD